MRQSRDRQVVHLNFIKCLSVTGETQKGHELYSAWVIWHLNIHLRTSLASLKSLDLKNKQTDDDPLSHNLEEQNVWEMFFICTLKLKFHKMWKLSYLIPPQTSCTFVHTCQFRSILQMINISPLTLVSNRWRFYIHKKWGWELGGCSVHPAHWGKSLVSPSTHLTELEWYISTCHCTNWKLTCLTVPVRATCQMNVLGVVW